MLMLTSLSSECCFLLIILPWTLGRIFQFLHMCLVLSLFFFNRVPDIVTDMLRECRVYCLPTDICSSHQWTWLNLNYRRFPLQGAATEIFHYFCQTFCSCFSPVTLEFLRVRPGFCRAYTQFVGLPFLGLTITFCLPLLLHILSYDSQNQWDLFSASVLAIPHCTGHRVLSGEKQTRY